MSLGLNCLAVPPESRCDLHIFCFTSDVGCYVSGYVSLIITAAEFSESWLGTFLNVRLG